MAKLEVVTDGWTPDDGKDYSPDEFYVRSTNRHDHSEAIRLRLPTEVLGQVGQLVQSGLVEDYRTNSDFVRDAIVHRLWYLNQLAQNGELERFLHLEMAMARADRAKREVDLALKTIKTWDDTLDAIRQAGDGELLALQIEVVESVAEGWRDPYRTRLLSVIARYK